MPTTCKHQGIGPGTNYMTSVYSLFRFFEKVAFPRHLLQYANKNVIARESNAKHGVPGGMFSN
jgi:hypothetical protein